MQLQIKSSKLRQGLAHLARCELLTLTSPEFPYISPNCIICYRYRFTEKSIRNNQCCGIVWVLIKYGNDRCCRYIFRIRLGTNAMNGETRSYLVAPVRRCRVARVARFMLVLLRVCTAHLKGKFLVGASVEHGCSLYASVG